MTPTLILSFPSGSEIVAKRQPLLRINSGFAALELVSFPVNNVVGNVNAYSPNA